MKIISVFNNKGGVGKSTLTYHLGHSLAKLGKKVLLLDMDPQCNLTICALMEEELHHIWQAEDAFIEDFEAANRVDSGDILTQTRSIHFLLKPAEDGINEVETLPPPRIIGTNIDLVPGRLSLHKYENRIAERWNGVYQGDNLAIRTITNIRGLSKRYADSLGYDYILIDTSPSLGILNKVIMSTVDGFFVPAQPDMFSLYGIRNIGNALEVWQREFNSIYSLISEDKRSKFPSRFVQFLGYTIYNSKKYTRSGQEENEYGLAQAHYQYVSRIPATILSFVSEANREGITDELISQPIGGDAIVHTHNTFPAMAQALKCPMWDVPTRYADLARQNPDYIELLNQNGFEYNRGNNGRLQEIGHRYERFTLDLLERINLL
ncbi:ParA family protein [Cyclobacterium salsum]|uniref:ParA family protein n=1 Tax=Cyclobacterium salsum TaxID=2666329 RepID=UPI0013912A7F|nr:AAA family ATPase [Cyclobacterium salsum]